MRRRDQRPHDSAHDSASAPRAALYMRVSTGRQAQHDLSIPDQRRQLTSWCRAQGYTVAAEFVEGGASGGDDRRPVFQEMIERACDGERAFELIVVHSYSRFFREAFEQEFYLRKLAKHGVKVASITQPVGDESEPVHAMMRKVIALFDEYQSKENAKHVIRSMKENARQGFWNGATTSFAIGNFDPLQCCADAAIDGMVHDPWLVRKLPQMLRGAGFEASQFRTYGYTSLPEPSYMLSLVDRGADLLLGAGRIGSEMADALKAEARRRAEVDCF